MTVLQPWVCELPMMMQSVLLGAIRGPDGHPKYNPTKKLLRWYRRCILVSSFDKVVLTDPYDPRGGSFTGPSFDVESLDFAALLDRLSQKGENLCFSTYVAQEYHETYKGDIKEFAKTHWPCLMTPLVDEFMKYIDCLPHHFLTHFMHGAEIVGYFHPDKLTRKWWNGLYVAIANDMHLQPESIAEILRRLSDDRDEWLKKSHPATTA